VLKCCLAEFLMCVLAPVRIFSVVCFLGVTANSVGGALSIRSGLDHLRIWAEISEFCGGFKLGIDGLSWGRSARPVADKLGTLPFRSDCASQNFSIIVTKKSSTRFYEIQGPVCVDGLVLQRRFPICIRDADRRVRSPKQAHRRHIRGHDEAAPAAQNVPALQRRGRIREAPRSALWIHPGYEGALGFQ
jgi:hypothetical protein